MYFIMSLLMWACQTERAQTPTAELSKPDQAAELPIVIEPSVLQSLADYQDIVRLDAPIDSTTIVLDTRPESSYKEGHIPGAVSLNVDLTWNNQFTLIPITEMEELLGMTGISQEHRVIIYDDGSFKNAARMFWILESHGHENLHILNGGIGLWKASNLPLSTTSTRYKASRFVAKIRPEHIATKLSVRQAIDDTKVALLDSRPPPEFQGLVAPLGKAGRIPSSINIEWSEITQAQEGYSTLKSPEELQDLFKSIPTETEQVITYCNKGKQSAVTYLGLKTAGYSVAAYDGSWYEWSQDDSLPIE